MSAPKLKDVAVSNGFELSIRKTIPAARAKVWRCWTDPELLKQWYCPKPWRVSHAEIDLRAGGRMNTLMAGPNGESHDASGMILEVVPMKRLVFTDAFSEDFVPKGTPFMTGFVELSDAPGGGTEMLWGARHWSAEDMAKHEAMGFHDGWAAAAAQLAELASQQQGTSKEQGK